MVSTENDFWKSIRDVAKKYEHKWAAIYVDDNQVLTRVTYKDMLHINKLLYKELLNYSDINNVCFGIFMEHNPYIPAIILCIQKLKCAFMFLDIHAAHIYKLLLDVNIKYIFGLTNVGQGCKFKYSSHLLSIPINETLAIQLYTYELNKVNFQTFEGVHFVVQTSGTTDIQKVVKVEHNCIISNVNCLRQIFEINDSDLIYYGTDLTFDPSIIELYLALTTGACLLIVSSTIKRNPSLLYKTLFLNNDIPKVTFLQMCPSAFLRWNQTEIQYILQNCLRTLVFGGEQFPLSVLKLDRSENLQIFNIYGITEVSCWASICKINSAEDNVSLGEPLSDTILVVRDENGCKITEGLGELYVGSNIRLCYINNETPDNIKKPCFRATGDQVMIKNSRLYYRGRNNDVIKRFGFRVNLEVVENIIFIETKLENKCVWLRDKMKLLLFIKIDEPDKSVQRKIIDKLRIKLLHCLTKEMFPDDIQMVSNFPITQNGKINKRVLENMVHCAINTKTSNDDLSQVFISMWTKYLGLNESDVRIFRNSSFYELGGNSILAAQFSGELREIMQVDYHTDFLDYLLTSSYTDAHNFFKSSNFINHKRKSNFENINVENVAKYEKLFNITLEVKWTYNLEACVDSSPAILKNGRVAVGAFSHIFVILNCENAGAISKIILPGAIESECCVSPCSTFVYVGCYDGYMYCINASDGHIAWQYQSGDKIKNRPCLVCQNTAIVFGSYDKSVHCVDIQTGLKVWKMYLAESITSNPIYLQSKSCVLIASVQGTCCCLDEMTGSVLWKLKVGCPVFGSPCVLDTFIIWPGVQGSIHGIDYNGQEIWKFQAGGYVYSSLIVCEKYIIFGCYDKNLYCIKPSGSNAALNFKLLLDSVISGAVCVVTYDTYSYIVAATVVGSIYLIDFKNGCVSSKFVLPGEIFSTPVADPNNIFIGCRDNNLYCIGFKNKQTYL